MLLGRDLAGALSEFGAIPPATVIGRAPLPGVTRVFHTSELQALAHRFNIPVGALDDVCFEWPMAPLNRDQAMAAMRDALQNPEARIEIGETGPLGAPPGRLEFKLARLGTPSAPGRQDTVWRGELVYGENSRMAVWAAVRIAVPCEKVIALEALKQGQPIQPEQIRMEAGECFPEESRAVSAGKVAGTVPVRPIAAGAEILMRALAPPNEVVRGEVAEIEVRSGRARLAFTARAEANGKMGDLVPFRNPASNRIFEARVTGRGRAAVILGPQESN
jgi:flagella basal body P-ring formation protein FlgA